ncbi:MULTISPECIES: hypothetical protein [unclassified Bradyrhizobium]|nr:MULTISPECIES: hypothetical protein [unclassified Bradyrhizobium]
MPVERTMIEEMAKPHGQPEPRLERKAGKSDVAREMTGATLSQHAESEMREAQHNRLDASFDATRETFDGALLG